MKGKRYTWRGTQGMPLWSRLLSLGQPIPPTPYEKVLDLITSGPGFIAQPQFKEGVCSGFLFGPMKGRRGRDSQILMNNLGVLLENLVEWEVEKQSHWWWCVRRNMSFAIRTGDNPPKKSKGKKKELP